MKTRREQMTSGAVDGYNNFLGDDSEYIDWLGFLGQHRDSEALARSNFRVGLAELGGESDDVRVERFGHWAVGWIEEIYIRPGTEAARKAEEMESALDGYPVLDDEDYCREESAEADAVWRSCFSAKERAAYIRKNPSEFEFDSLGDMRQCVRGEFFNGDSFHLLH